MFVSLTLSLLASAMNPSTALVTPNSATTPDTSTATAVCILILLPLRAPVFSWS